MAHWLVKQEPDSWSWDDHVKAGVAAWEGVRNYQAAKNLRAMKTGDTAFMYHTGNQKQIVGVLEVVKEYYPDPKDKTDLFGMVDFKAVRPLATPVTLAQVKADKRLHHLALVRQARLSVMPIDDAAWKIICEWGGVWL